MSRIASILVMSTALTACGRSDRPDPHFQMVATSDAEVVWVMDTGSGEVWQCARFGKVGGCSAVGSIAAARTFAAFEANRPAAPPNFDDLASAALGMPVPPPSSPSLPASR